MKFTKKLIDVNFFVASLEEAQLLAGVDMLEKLIDLTEPSVPVLSGRMKGTGDVERTKKRVVAGFNTEYAFLNHQGIDRNGNKIERKSGEDRWLARTIELNKDNLIKLLAINTNKRFRND